MKIALRQGAPAIAGELIQHKTWGKQTEMTVSLNNAARSHACCRGKALGI